MTREQRRLAAIVAADVVGYSRLMGRDESGTVARLRRNKSERFDPVLAGYGGRLVKLTGDGALMEFSSAVDALGAAITFQQAMAEANQGEPADYALVFRLGLHLGDLIVDGDDLYGDGVNVAARLEAEAPAGGIVVSGAIHEAVAGRVKARFDDLGRLSLKNIERPVQAYSMRWQAADWPMIAMADTAPAQTPARSVAPLSLAGNPSIAVLPFLNMSGDPDQEYFADGIVEDIITALSRFKSLFVISRNSSFFYKGKSPDVRQVGRELGVRYVLEGSVRKAGNRVRITGQLIEAATNAHLWADRFEGPMDDIFTLQDKVTSSVVGVVEPTIQRSEIQRALAKPTGNLNAYDYYLRGLPKYNKWTRAANEEAHGLFSAALELDPHYAAAMIQLAFVHAQRLMQNWTDDRQREAMAGKRLQERALELAKEDQFVLAGSAYLHVQFGGDVATAVSLIDRAMNLNPNSSVALETSTWIRVRSGDPELAIEHCLRAMQLNPLNQTRTPLAIAYFLLGREQEALVCIDEALINAPRALPTLRFAAIIKAGLGRVAEARQVVKRTLEINPNAWAASGPTWVPDKPEYQRKWTEARRLLDQLRYPE